MLTLLNSYSHGYVAAPVIDSCRRLKIFAALDMNVWRPAEELSVRTGTQAGYLRIARHLLQCMGWLEQRRDEDGADSYRLTELADLQAVPEGISDLYHIAALTPALPALIILSARNDERLLVHAASLLKFAQDAAQSGVGAGRNQHEEQQWLIALACTLQRRQPMDARLALTASTVHELQGKLASCLDGKAAPAQGIWRGNLKMSQAGRHGAGWPEEEPGLSESIAAWMASGQTWKAAQYWVKGLSVDWDLLYGAHRPRRTSAPTYPFARGKFRHGDGAKRCPVQARHDRPSDRLSGSGTCGGPIAVFHLQPAHGRRNFQDG